MYGDSGTSREVSVDETWSSDTLLAWEADDSVSGRDPARLGGTLLPRPWSSLITVTIIHHTITSVIHGMLVVMGRLK